MTDLLAALTACTPATDTAASSAENRPVEGQAPWEPLDAGALQERLIAYATSLRETADASEYPLSSATKNTLTPLQPACADGQAENQPMVDGYALHASYGGLVSGMQVLYHCIYAFRPCGRPFTDDPHAPCFWTSSAAEQAFAESGYTRGPERASQKECLQWYRRTSPGGYTVFYVDLLTHATGDSATDTCFYEMQFAGDVLSKELMRAQSTAHSTVQRPSRLQWTARLGDAGAPPHSMPPQTIPPHLRRMTMSKIDSGWLRAFDEAMLAPFAIDQSDAGMDEFLLGCCADLSPREAALAFGDNYDLDRDDALWHRLRLERKG